MNDQEKMRTILNYLSHLPPAVALEALGEPGDAILAQAAADLAADLNVQKSQLQGQIADIEEKITSLNEI